MCCGRVWRAARARRSGGEPLGAEYPSGTSIDGVGAVAVREQERADRLVVPGIDVEERADAFRLEDDAATVAVRLYQIIDAGFSQKLLERERLAKFFRDVDQRKLELAKECRILLHAFCDCCCGLPKRSTKALNEVSPMYA